MKGRLELFGREERSLRGTCRFPMRYEPVSTPKAKLRSVEEDCPEEDATRENRKWKEMERRESLLHAINCNCYF